MSTSDRLTSERQHLDWLAFCYVANELAPAERQEFEDSLAVEQVAREALARAVETTRIVAVAQTIKPATPLATPRVSVTGTRWSRRIQWMSLGAAAAVLLMFTIAGITQRQTVWSWLNGRTGSVDRELASAWTETRQDLGETKASDWVVDELTSAEVSVQISEDDDATVGFDTSSLDSETPSWLTAALLAQAGGATEEPAAERLEN